MCDFGNLHSFRYKPLPLICPTAQVRRLSLRPPLMERAERDAKPDDLRRENAQV